ncbi:MAG: DUF1015 domain-containing protein [Dehalococcoidia bacterium]
MVDFRPFRGVRYDTTVAGNMADLVCPPYDVISSTQEQALLSQNPNNMVLLELAELSGPAPADRYAKAAAAYQNLQASGVLRRDEQPSYYLLRQRFNVGAQTHERFGIFGALRIEELGKGVLPHEDTAAGPKQDRLALMEATQANFSPTMMLYRDPEGRVRQVRDQAVTKPPEVEFSVDGEHYTCWAISDPDSTKVIQEALSSQPAYIADGHHRYETSIVYRDKKGGQDDAASRFVLTCMLDFEDPGLLILPYYRVLHGLNGEQLEKLHALLAEYFTSASVGIASAAELDQAVAKAGVNQVVLGVVEQGKEPYLLTPASDSIPRFAPNDPPERQMRTVEAWVLQELLFRPVVGDAFPEHVAYVHDGQHAMDMVAKGEGQVAFFIKGVPADAFESVVGAGIRLPRKSTYFYPKLPSGLVINPLEGRV